MPSSKDISSTERLLRLIRGNEAPNEVSGTVDISPSGTVKGGGTRGFLSKKPISVGVDIGPDELRLIKVRQAPSGRCELLDYRKVFIESGMVRFTPPFADFLRSELEAFCSLGRNVEVWSLIPFDKVDVESIRIPKVGRKQLENAVYWTTKKNAPFDEEETVLEFEVQGEVLDGDIPKMSVVVLTASRHEVAEMQSFFTDIGFPLTGLTAPPFALQNLLRSDWLSLPDRTATLYIGDASSRIDVFSEGSLLITRGIRAGISSMAEALLEKHPPALSLDGMGEEGGREQARNPMNIEDAKDLVFSLGFDSPPPYGEADRFGLSKEEIFEMINPALERLVRQVERTLEHCTLVLGSEGIQSIYVFSDAGVYRPVVDYIGGQLRVESDILDPMAQGEAFPRRITKQASTSQRASLTPSLGVALSTLSRTPNLVFTHSDREKLKVTKRFNRVIVSAFAMGIVILAGVFFWMEQGIDRKETVLARLDQQLERGVDAVEDVTRERVSEIKGNRLLLERFKKRYLGVAVIGELSKLTPTGVHLLSVKATMGGDGKGAKRAARGATIDGVVTGDLATLESVLAGYVLDLKNSRIFRRVEVGSNAIGRFHADQALHFSITVEFS